MTTFTADPADFLGETVTVGRHALDGDRQPAVCPCHELCTSFIVADGPLAGRDWAPWDNYDGRHRWNVRRRRAVRRVS